MPISRKPSTARAEIRFAGRARFGTTRERTQALSLIRRFATAPGVSVAGLTLSAAVLQALNGGRSAARVFKLTPFFGAARKVKGAPVVVKIAPRAEGIRERANYDEFVRWALPSACRPELLGFGLTRSRAGIIYSFAGDRDAAREGSRTGTLTDHLQRGDTATLEFVLHRFLDLMCDTWYGTPLLRTESNISGRYLDHYFAGARPKSRAGLTPRERSLREATLREATLREATLRTCAARYFDARHKDDRYLIGGLSFPSPRAVLFGSGRKRPYRSCILHGDLNTDNILVAVDPAGDPPCMTLVDFLKTGRGHVYEDLVALEASVRINYPPDASFGEILETERRIALGLRLPRNDPYSASIRKVRDAALRHFGRVEDDANYHFAVAAIGLRLMRALDLSHIARARITASALWAAKVVAGE